MILSKYTGNFTTHYSHMHICGYCIHGIIRPNISGEFKTELMYYPFLNNCIYFKENLYLT